MHKQGSEGWFLDRMGKATGSKAAAIMGTAAARERYLCDLAAEIATGQVHTVDAPALAHGKQYEPRAREQYIFQTGYAVEEVGFIDHPTVDRVGCSPDGLVESDGMIEIKCPKIISKHVATLLNGMNEKEHKPQVQWNIWTTDRAWCDFCSFCPDMPPQSQLFVQRIVRDDEYIEKLAVAAVAFIVDLDLLMEKIL